MLRGCDLLVAVWDGAEQAGLGGTGGVVERALASGLPVLWVRSEHDAPVSIMSPTGEPEPTLSIASPEAIRALVGEILLPPDPDEPALNAFFEERWRPACGWVLFDWLKKFPRVWKWRWPLRMHALAAFEAEWARFKACIFDGGPAPRTSEPIVTRAALADNAATYFAHRYRSAYILTYGLSTAAIAVALLDVFEPHAAWLRAVLAVVEFGFVVGILAIIRIGRKAMWHQRWLDYRYLAELLRHLRFLIPIGDPDASFRRSGRLSRPDWVSWYARATAREVAPRSGVLDAAFQRRLLAAVVECEIRPQIDYHRGNALSLKELDHRLHRLGVLCFFTVLALLGLKLAIMALGPLAHAPAHDSGAVHAFERITTYFDVLLPAIGAALAGIRYTGEFKTFAEQSTDMLAALRASEHACAEAEKAPDLAHTLRVLGTLANVLSAETSRWRALYGRKHLVLPG
jgi:hypothetical protein